MTAQTLTTNTQTNLDGVCNRAMGKIVTDAGTTTAQTITLGFTPRHFKITNVTALTSDEWFSGMATSGISGEALHTTTSGAAITDDTTNGIIVSGGTVTLAKSIMTASSTFYWIAEM